VAQPGGPAYIRLASLGGHPPGGLAHTDPAHTDPAHTDPAHTDLAHTDPAHTDPPHPQRPGQKGAEFSDGSAPSGWASAASALSLMKPPSAFSSAAGATRSLASG
jgi:hypothetical protein